MGAKDNPKGHYEDKQFLSINDRLLKANGGSWHNPPDGIGYRGMKNQMQLFLDKWPQSKTVGWKDPRICLTFHLWHRLIHPEQIRVVMVYRKKENIALSLQARNNFSIERGLALAKIYYREAWKNTRLPSVLVHLANFEALTRNWLMELEPICEFLKLKNIDERACEEFMDQRLIHHRGIDEG